MTKEEFKILRYGAIVEVVKTSDSIRRPLGEYVMISSTNPDCDQNKIRLKKLNEEILIDIGIEYVDEIKISLPKK